MSNPNKYHRHTGPFILLFAFFSFLSLPQTAYAYLDPDTGSFVFQIIIATLLGGIFAIKIYFGKIKLLFKNIFSKKTKEQKR